MMAKEKSKLNKKLVKVFENVCEANEKITKRSGDEQISMIGIIHKDYSVTMTNFTFSSSDEKIFMRQILKSMLLDYEMYGYIFVTPVKLTIMDPEKKKEPEAKDAIMRKLYTPKGARHSVLFHEGKKIKDKIEGDTDPQDQDEWDLWGKPVEVSEPAAKAYQEFKKNNPEIFKCVS